MVNPLPNIDHVVVLMLENRSFDNLLGWIYTREDPPGHIVSPRQPPLPFQGLDGADFCNPTSFANGEMVRAQRGTRSMLTPTPDPNEKFKHMNQQIFGANVSGPNWLPPEGAPATMNGFLVDYAEAKHSSPSIAPQIMETYSPEQVTALSALAGSFAVSDAWHASTPTQTLPNRAFMAAGTSEGQVNNLPWPVYGAKTIFNVLEDHSVDWRVYTPSKILPSLTRMAMVRLWDLLLSDHFHSIERFEQDARQGRLPAYSFLEPSFIDDDLLDVEKTTSEHPPTDVCSGDHYLARIWEAIRTGKDWERTLFVLTFDEHGGCADHVPTPWGAAPPDECSMPGDEGFGFDRFGVRIPTVIASPYVQPRTVFRSPDPQVPYDHTSTLATVLDWQGIDRSELPSARIGRACTFESVQNGEKARLDPQPIQARCTISAGPSADRELTDLEQGVLAAFELYRRYKDKPIQEVEELRTEAGEELPPVLKSLFERVRTRAEAVEYLSKAAPPS